MPVRRINGIDLSYQVYGTGDPVLLIPGTGARGTIFRAYLVPALMSAGFRSVAVDPRGVPPTDAGEAGFTLHDLVADMAALIETVAGGPCRVVGFSMGALVAQELALARPDLVARAVLMATRARTDALSAAHTTMQLKMLDGGAALPPRYEAILRMYQGFSRRTRCDEEVVHDWLDLFEMSIVNTRLSRDQLRIDQIPDRRSAYRQIAVDTLVVAFGEDLLTPPAMCREVADAIPGARYHEIPGCGHFGYVEEPELVNAAVVDFLHDGRSVEDGAMSA